MTGLLTRLAREWRVRRDARRAARARAARLQPLDGLTEARRRHPSGWQ